MWAVELDTWAPPPLVRGAEVREVISAADADALAEAMGPEGDLVEDRLRRGCRAYGVWLGDTLAAYGWLTAGPEWIGEVGMEIRPKAGEAYLWNCVTLPAHRLHGLFRLLVVSVCEALQSQGFHRLWIASVEGTAEKAVADAGFVPVLTVERSPSPRRH